LYVLLQSIRIGYNLLIGGFLFKERRHDTQLKILDPPSCGFS